MIESKEYFNYPISNEEKKLVEKIIKEINLESDYQFTFNDGLLILMIKNNILKKLKQKHNENHPIIHLKQIIHEIIEDELEELVNQIKSFNSRKEDLIKFINYLIMIKNNE
ncbi:MAG: hypothetical protein HeimC2_40070 [Candidatus Heimdallarchaeota archaeon LC_2]|nr:MAG: hypothetical protein HeimC2_40070 [Candidatus Heimdallarchaeota archaeon LC_2]